MSIHRLPRKQGRGKVLHGTVQYRRNPFQCVSCSAFKSQLNLSVITFREPRSQGHLAPRNTHTVSASSKPSLEDDPSPALPVTGYAQLPSSARNLLLRQTPECRQLAVGTRTQQRFVRQRLGVRRPRGSEYPVHPPAPNRFFGEPPTFLPAPHLISSQAVNHPEPRPAFRPPWHDILRPALQGRRQGPNSRQRDARLVPEFPQMRNFGIWPAWRPLS